ncbi:hypothetical protein BU23DRAFT_166047 [Bimuria novae-zelandiae CBS 107.79]|uniref:Uncharacterized protein n=1 Tax=Bimuria novae-zelandiae CBS 107.79 TaxID=1447943 RepID=A0A6A5V7T8_9PLEO|nr:hypothetical protein BU23DRAFT_166047 [Bimuria novae-zelandiae CBS 107.79]
MVLHDRLTSGADLNGRTIPRVRLDWTKEMTSLIKLIPPDGEPVVPTTSLQSSVDKAQSFTASSIAISCVGLACLSAFFVWAISTRLNSPAFGIKSEHTTFDVSCFEYAQSSWPSVTTAHAIRLIISIPFRDPHQCNTSAAVSTTANVVRWLRSLFGLRTVITTVATFTKYKRPTLRAVWTSAKFFTPNTRKPGSVVQEKAKPIPRLAKYGPSLLPNDCQLDIVGSSRKPPHLPPITSPPPDTHSCPVEFALLSLKAWIPWITSIYSVAAPKMRLLKRSQAFSPPRGRCDRNSYTISRNPASAKLPRHHCPFPLALVFLQPWRSVLT